jgi:hypothetical protein
VLFAAIGLLLSLVTAYYTLVQERYRLEIVHPDSSLKVERDGDLMLLSISGDMQNLNAPGVTFENSGNRPVTVTRISYILDLNSNNPPSCKHGFRYFLIDGKFIPTVIKPSEAVVFNNAFTVDIPVTDWTKLFVQEQVYGLACISVQIADAGLGTQEVVHIFGALQIPKSNLEAFKHINGRSGGMQVPLQLAGRTLSVLNYIK